MEILLENINLLEGSYFYNNYHKLKGGNHSDFNCCINKPDKRKRTALSVYIVNCSKYNEKVKLKVIKVLANKKSVRDRDYLLRNALHLYLLTTKKVDEKIVKELSTKEVINSLDSFSEAPVHIYIKMHSVNIDMLRDLLTQENINQLNYELNTPAMLFLKKSSDQEILKILTDDKSNISKDIKNNCGLSLISLYVNNNEYLNLGLVHMLKPSFCITGDGHPLLIYLTTKRRIYKKNDIEALASVTTNLGRYENDPTNVYLSNTRVVNENIIKKLKIFKDNPDISEIEMDDSSMVTNEIEEYKYETYHPKDEIDLKEEIAVPEEGITKEVKNNKSTVNRKNSKGRNGHKKRNGHKGHRGYKKHRGKK